MGAGCEEAGGGGGGAGVLDEAGAGAGVWLAGGLVPAGLEEELVSLLPLDAGGTWLLEELELLDEVGLEPDVLRVSELEESSC